MEAGVLEDVLLQLCCPPSPGGAPLRTLTCTRCADDVPVEQCMQHVTEQLQHVFGITDVQVHVENWHVMD